MLRVVTISSVLALALVACGKKDPGKEAPKPTTGSGSNPGSAADTAPGGATADAAAHGLFDAFAKQDKTAATRFLPNAAACKVLASFKQCSDLVANFAKSSDAILTAGAPYAKAQLVKSKDPSPLEGGTAYTATVDGKDPMTVVALKAGDRYFAVFSINAVKPPSTGKEMPSDQLTMKPEQAKAIVAEAVKHAGDAKPDCPRIVDALSSTLPVAYPEMAAEAAPAYKVLQRCALETKHWRAAIQAGVKLLPFNPDVFNVVQIVRALAEMGQYDEAIDAAKDLATRFPGAHDALVESVVFTYCRAEAWDLCEKNAITALAEFTSKHEAPTTEGMIMGRYFRDLAWVVTGHPKEALEDTDALEKLAGKPLPMFDDIKAAAPKTIERGFYMEYFVVPQLATGVYHLMGKSATGALVTLKLREHTGATRTFRIEAEVPGVTERSSNSLTLGPKESTIKYLNPPLKMDFDPNKVRGPRPSQLALRIVETAPTGDKTIVDETLPIEVLPRDYLPLRRKVGADSLVPTYGFLGAWITSNDKAVDEFLGKAKQRLPKREFVGEQDTTIPQIKAIYEELHGRGMSYVMDPEVTAMTSFVQRTRLPGDVLSSTNAQCLEGTLTFATLMEAIGIKPIVVLVPGHAFVGWHTVAADNTKGEPLFVETTMVGNYGFEQAVGVATRRVESELKAGSFKSGAANFVDIAKIHAQGFTAQPM